MYYVLPSVVFIEVFFLIITFTLDLQFIWLRQQNYLRTMSSCANVFTGLLLETQLFKEE